MSRVLISMAGQIGSGKTEVCREIGRRTEWKIVSAGGILRKMAVDHGLALLEFNEYAKSHKEIDEEIDHYLASLDTAPYSLIIDSRLAWHFLPSSLKVYLIVDPQIGAERVFGASRSDETHASAKTAGVDNAERQRLEHERFFALYKVDPSNWRNYDLIIDTSYATPSQVADAVMKQVEGATGSVRPECWLSPKRLVPTKPASGCVNETVLDEMTVVDIALSKDQFRIVDGHARAAAALRSERPLVRCRLVA